MNTNTTSAFRSNTFAAENRLLRLQQMELPPERPREPGTYDVVPQIPGTYDLAPAPNTRRQSQGNRGRQQPERQGDRSRTRQRNRTPNRRQPQENGRRQNNGTPRRDGQPEEVLDIVEIIDEPDTRIQRRENRQSTAHNDETQPGQNNPRAEAALNGYFRTDRGTRNAGEHAGFFRRIENAGSAAVNDVIQAREGWFMETLHGIGALFGGRSSRQIATNGVYIQQARELVQHADQTMRNAGNDATRRIGELSSGAETTLLFYTAKQRQMQQRLLDLARERSRLETEASRYRNGSSDRKNLERQLSLLTDSQEYTNILRQETETRLAQNSSLVAMQTFERSENELAEWLRSRNSDLIPEIPRLLRENRRGNGKPMEDAISAAAGNGTNERAVVLQKIAVARSLNSRPDVRWRRFSMSSEERMHSQIAAQYERYRLITDGDLNPLNIRDRMMNLKKMTGRHSVAITLNGTIYNFAKVSGEQANGAAEEDGTTPQIIMLTSNRAPNCAIDTQNGMLSVPKGDGTYQRFTLHAPPVYDRNRKPIGNFRTEDTIYFTAV